MKGDELLDKLDKITEQEWLLCNEFNRKLKDEFIENSTDLSPKTRSTYNSNLMIWFNYVRQYCDNRKQIELKPLDLKKYQNWLLKLNHSSSDISNKRSAISSLNNYLLVYYSDTYPLFHNFVNKGVKKPEKNPVHKKEPPTKAEFENLISELERREEWQYIAYLKFTFETGCRRAESRQLLKNIINISPIVKTIKVKNEDGIEEEKISTFYVTPEIRCKGAGVTGKLRKLRFSDYAMDALKKWIEERGEDDCEFMFVARYGGVMKQVSENTFNQWSARIFTPILGRRFYPHAIRSARATSVVIEDGKSIESAQRLLGHSSSETTRIYVVKDVDDDESDELFID